MVPTLLVYVYYICLDRCNLSLVEAGVFGGRGQLHVPTSCCLYVALPFLGHYYLSRKPRKVIKQIFIKFTTFLLTYPRSAPLAVLLVTRIEPRPRPFQPSSYLLSSQSLISQSIPKQESLNSHHANSSRSRTATERQLNHLMDILQHGQDLLVFESPPNQLQTNRQTVKILRLVIYPYIHSSVSQSVTIGG